MRPAATTGACWAWPRARVTRGPRRVPTAKRATASWRCRCRRPQAMPQAVGSPQSIIPTLAAASTFPRWAALSCAGATARSMCSRWAWACGRAPMRQARRRPHLPHLLNSHAHHYSGQTSRPAVATGSMRSQVRRPRPVRWASLAASPTRMRPTRRRPCAPCRRRRTRSSTCRRVRAAGRARSGDPIPSLRGLTRPPRPPPPEQRIGRRRARAPTRF